MKKDICEILKEQGEFYAAEVLGNEGREPVYRYSKAQAEYLKNAELTPYDGGMLYPCGLNINKSRENSRIAVRPEFSYTYHYDYKILEEKNKEAADLFLAECKKVASIDTPHTVGGAGYTHSFINYRRILKDGLKGYKERVNKLPDCDFKEAMLLLLDGIECFRLRCIEHLTENNAEPKLIEALKYVPENSPRNIYEALVAWNFAYYIDGCDDIGGLDRGLLPYFKGEDIRPLLKELYTHVDINDGWSEPLGPDYNELTVQCIDAIHNIRRPSIQLLVTKDMPKEVWQAACRAIETSCGQPALYNWDIFKEEVLKRCPEVREEDIKFMAFGGCTETMIEGLSNVGSDDAGINTALIFDKFMRENLHKFEKFEDFMAEYAKETEKVIGETCDILEEYRKTRAKYRPQPVRTLFIDDCIDKMLDFNAGGARYNWSVMNVAGLVNVIDSMVAIKNLVFENKKYTAEEFIGKLDSSDEALLLDCKKQPKHGNDIKEVNDIASYLSKRIYGEFEKHTCTPAGRYFAVSNQFTTYVDAGRCVKATPDGRKNGDPLCDSCGAVHGRDTLGPTALLSSVASLNLNLVLGTPVTNIRISKNNVSSLLKPLTEGFFDMGGMQLQVTCASKEELLDAKKNPEKYPHLIVRVGGFAEYFNRLSPELKETVIARTEY